LNIHKGKVYIIVDKEAASKIENIWVNYLYFIYMDLNIFKINLVLIIM
jgi:hypothetical protein